jgi:hypothetical protein
MPRDTGAGADNQPPGGCPRPCLFLSAVFLAYTDGPESRFCAPERPIRIGPADLSPLYPTEIPQPGEELLKTSIQ